MHQITLTEPEQRLVQYVAKKRISFHKHKEKTVSENYNRWERTQIEIDVEGFGGELAYCKLMNIYPDLDVELNNSEYDCLSHNGERIDVKTTRYKKGHLIVPVRKSNYPADKYVLVTGDFPVYNVVGECNAGELFREENIKDFGRGAGYTLEQDKLEDVL